jgi:hypothetical protein
MIGQLKVPQSLEADRFTLRDPSHGWRDIWDQFDAMLGGVLIAVSALPAMPPVSVLSFRSNRCEISLLKERGSWSIAWDERFFDYIVLQLMALAATDSKTIENMVFGTLFRYAGEIQMMDDPHYALLLARAGYSYYDGELQSFDAKADMVKILPIIFRIMRTFILCHELGHIGMRDLEFRKQEANNLRNAIQLYKDMAADKSRIGQYSSEENSQRVLGMAGETAVKEEILVDSFALGQTFEAEKAALEKQGMRIDGPHVINRLALIYQAMMLLYYCMATMNGVKEMMSPKAIVHNIGLRQFRSVAALSSRSDIRGTLWSMMAAQHFDFDPRKAIRITKAIKHPKRNLMERYRATQLPVYEAMLQQTDRKGLLSDADDLRKKISIKDAANAVAHFYAYSSNEAVN